MAEKVKSKKLKAKLVRTQPKRIENKNVKFNFKNSLKFFKTFKANLVEQKCLGKQNFNLEKGICECAGRENLNNTDQMLICNFNPINCTYDPVDADNVWPTMQKSFESVAGNLPENLLNFTLSLTSVMNQTLTNIAEAFEFVFSNLENLKFDFNT